MKMNKKVGGGIPFARKAPYTYKEVEYEADLKNGDIVTILDSGTIEQGQYGEQRNFKIKTRNGERKIAFNQKTVNVLIDEFGDDSIKWVNKDVIVILKKDVIANKKVIIPFLVTEGWSLDDYGELIKEGGSEKKEDTVEYPEEEIDPEDIPF